ncbi:hypothetical protein [Radiobacillus sp. PE A8.2]|uniref:hypothetical protein n=1 Tax=Radiobacillus sp. PE A8.2 TaxID=3380349 RepID=UPI00388D6E02
MLDVSLADMIEEEFVQRLYQVYHLIVSILEAFGVEDIPPLDEIPLPPMDELPPLKGLPALSMEDSVLAEGDVDTKQLHSILAVDELKAMLTQLITLANELEAEDDSDVVSTYQALETFYTENIESELTEDPALDSSLQPIVGQIFSVLEGFFSTSAE